MSSEWDKTCLVCGIRTENRCSSCAKAGIDLFFCSPDHQKLMWKWHRRVCGPGKANPFIWPLLSQLEADEIIEHMHESTGTFAEPGPGPSTVAEGVQYSLRLSPEKLAYIVPKVTEGAPMSIWDGHLAAQQTVLACVRAYETMRIKHTLYKRSSPPIDALKALVGHDFIVATNKEYGTEPWRTQYRHFVLAKIVLHDLDRLTRHREPPAEWRRLTRECIIVFENVVISRTHPEIVEYLHEKRARRALKDEARAKARAAATEL
ncbi:hypothetical protein JCM3775_002166 [Rhodotorula graminis]|uniref:MYND-type domain-containing protein n=1 Tax=Rhodotorula graminis (strain WP1) TaxID=578459 RepID=A0A0P9F7G6_RHOGW|nr:uncharacterized protein RHOBADRAFT_56464 [Rhodotorula graminis WP1]KPV71618.1 hypothetical protein RHOBADRAFT_56464 [Rhodotorula graminis WP1]